MHSSSHMPSIRFLVCRQWLQRLPSCRCCWRVGSLPRVALADGVRAAENHSHCRGVMQAPLSRLPFRCAKRAPAQLAGPADRSRCRVGRQEMGSASHRPTCRKGDASRGEQIPMDRARGTNSRLQNSGLAHGAQCFARERGASMLFRHSLPRSGPFPPSCIRRVRHHRRPAA